MIVIAILVVAAVAIGWALLAHAKRSQLHPQGTVRKIFGFVPKQGQYVSVQIGDDKYHYIVIKPPWEAPGGRLVFRGLNTKQAKYGDGSQENINIATQHPSGWHRQVELVLEKGRR